MLGLIYVNLSAELLLKRCALASMAGRDEELYDKDSVGVFVS